jgi:ATP-binding cassette subfamily B protein
MAWRSAPYLVLINAPLVATQAVLPLLFLYILKQIVDLITKHFGDPSASEVLASLTILIVLAAGVTLCENLVRVLGWLIGDALGESATDYVYGLIHAKSVEIDLAYYENAEYRDTLHRAQREAAYRPTRVVNALLAIGSAGLALLSIAGMLTRFSYAVIPLLFLAAIPGAVARMRVSRSFFALKREITASERLAFYLHDLLTRSGHAKELRIFNIGPLFISQFRELRRCIRRDVLSRRIRWSLAEFVNDGVAVLAVCGVIGAIGYAAIQSSITIGDFVMYFQAVRLAWGYMGQILRNASQLFEDALFISDLESFLQQTPTIRDNTCLSSSATFAQGALAFESVEFCYPTDPRPTLRNISFRVEAGEHVAVVGENGAGKSTLIKLLCRFYDPTSGCISISGVDIRKLPVADWRREIGIIFQDYAQYEMTVRENIWFGDIALAKEDDRVRHVASETGADQFVARLRSTYETRLGHLFDQSEELSAGEWQKLALSRALLRRSGLLVLDEPTSAFDADAEHRFLGRLRQLAAGRTVILISHRLSAVKDMDRIYVLQNGEIVEQGIHGELIRLGGAYAKLFFKQASHYV